MQLVWKYCSSKIKGHPRVVASLIIILLVMHKRWMCACAYKGGGVPGYQYVICTCNYDDVINLLCK